MLLNDQQVASGSLDGNIILWNLVGKVPLTKMKVLSPSGNPETENLKKGITGLAYNYL